MGLLMEGACPSLIDVIVVATRGLALSIMFRVAASVVGAERTESLWDSWTHMSKTVMRGMIYKGTDLYGC